MSPGQLSLGYQLSMVMPQVVTQWGMCAFPCKRSKNDIKMRCWNTYGYRYVAAK